MLTDIHSICGYLVAKYLYESNFSSSQKALLFLPQSQLFTKFQQSLNTQSKSSSNLWRLSLSHWRNRISSQQKNNSFSIVKFIRNVLSGTSFEERYILCGIILGNLPDVDVLLTPLFGGYHSFHRTATHSLYGNMVIVPVAGYIMYRVLGLKGAQSLRHCIYFAFLCISSHIVTDYITNYGVCNLCIYVIILQLTCSLDISILSFVT
jgi:hypothetical protein